MRPSGWLFLTQLFICCALALSAVLIVHYLNPADSDFCGLQSGCEAVRQSGLGYFFGSRYLSLPLVALLGFGGLLALSLRRSLVRPAAGQIATRHPSGALARLWQAPELSLFVASGLGAMVALVLLGYQVVLGEYCWLCVLVDFAAVLAAFSAFLLAQSLGKTRVPPRSALAPAAWIAIAGSLVLAPVLWNAIRPPPPIPGRISALYVAGKINVVEFADFECPYCRKLHGVLTPLLTEYGDQVHFLRFQRPLMQHRHADQAARAALCAEAQGRGEVMADKLFTTPLSLEAISSIAEGLRLDPLAYDACMGDPRTTATLEQHAALLPDGELQGLPTTYVGDQALVGVPTEAALRDAFERARRPPSRAPSGTLYVTLLAALIGLIAFFGWRRAEGASPDLAAP
jgi:predicted DsbA family dithiol-disulfide isomerase